jgi:hypothetical protein
MRAVRDGLRIFLLDLRFGFRVLRKDRGYAVAAITASAVGIGANAALFTLLLENQNVSDPDTILVACGFNGSFRLDRGVLSGATGDETRSIWALRFEYQETVVGYFEN